MKKILLVPLVLSSIVAGTAFAISEYPVKLNIDIGQNAPLEFSHELGMVDASACGFSPKKNRYQCDVKLLDDRFGVAFRNRETGGTCAFSFNKNKNKIYTKGLKHCGSYYRVNLRRGLSEGTFTIILY